MHQKINITFEQKYNINFIRAKTKILVCRVQQLDTNIIIDSIKLKNVKSFTYLRNKVITRDKKSATNINCKIVQLE